MELGLDILIAIAAFSALITYWITDILRQG